MTNLLISLLFPLMMAVTPIDSTLINQDPVFDKKNCTCNGTPLYGKVKIVEIGEDFKVRIVNISEDLKVEIVNISPYECGKWEFVEISEDFKVRFVEIGEDFKIRFVDISPGTD